jgi:tetratricopeptide (TPR) repeat protein
VVGWRTILVALSLVLAAFGSVDRVEAGGSLYPHASTAVSNESDGFDDLSRRAEEARDSGRLAEAVDLYRRSLELRPLWLEGWWYLGTLCYDLDRYPEGRDAFRRLVSISADMGPAWALLGLCEFQTREYDRALASLQRARSLGLGGSADLGYAALYHMALLFNRFEQFESAFVTLQDLVRTHLDNPQLVEALGLSVLRLPFLPTELPADRREPVLLAGRGAANWIIRRFDEAERYFRELGDRYPEMPNVRYARGVYLLQDRPDEALAEFRRELEISPSHLQAVLQIAFEYLKRGDYESALPWAEMAVELDPQSFVARNALGRIFHEIGETDRAIDELEKGLELAPDSPEMHFALARAYTRAGRREDAQRARTEFQRLDRIRRGEGSPEEIQRPVESVPREGGPG